MILTNRAWVFAQPWPKAINFLEGGKIEIEKIEVRQYGNTPAKVYELHICFSAQEPNGDVALYPGEPIRHVYNLGPNNQWWHREKFETTDARPYIFGYVRYTDIWGENRESRFCYLLTRYTDAIRFPFRTAGSEAYSRFT